MKLKDNEKFTYVSKERFDEISKIDKDLDIVEVERILKENGLEITDKHRLHEVSISDGIIVELDNGVCSCYKFEESEEE